MVEGLESDQQPEEEASIEEAPDAPSSAGPATNEWLAIPAPKARPMDPAPPSLPDREELDRENGNSARESRPSPPRRKNRPSPLPPQSSTPRGAVGQYRRLAAGLRKVRQEVGAQKSRISKLESELKDAQAEAARLREAVKSAGSGSGSRVKGRGPSAAKLKALNQEIDERLTAAEQRAKRREETTRRQLADGLQTIEKHLAEQDSGLDTRLVEVERRLKKRERTTRRQLADSTEELEGKLRAELSETIDQLERTEAALTAEFQPNKRPKAKPRKTPKAKLPEGKLDVNALTFEQFRQLGLSLTQSSRMIALRDRHGEITDIDEIDKVVGLPAELRAMLKRRLTVG